MSTEKSKLDQLIDAKVAAGLSRRDAEDVAKRQIAEDEAAEAAAAKAKKSDGEGDDTGKKKR